MQQPITSDASGAGTRSVASAQIESAITAACAGNQSRRERAGENAASGNAGRTAR